MREEAQPIEPASCRPDLHVHSHFSDGLHAPETLCAMAVAAGLTHIALCDHDTLAGITPMRQAAAAHNAANAGTPLVFLPGIELSTGTTGQTHMLGYGAGPDNAPLTAWLENARHSRRIRFRQMLSKLSSLGMEIPLDMLPPLDDDLPLGRAHLARALVRLGKANTLDQCFTRFLGAGRPAYVPYAHPSAGEAASLLRRAGLVPVLAHPARLSLRDEALFALIRSLAQEGLMGVEVYHPSASRRQVRTLDAFARREGLLVTGGSDYHGDSHLRASLGSLPCPWPSSCEDTKALLSAVEKERLATV